MKLTEKIANAFHNITAPQRFDPRSKGSRKATERRILMVLAAVMAIGISAGAGAVGLSMLGAWAATGPGGGPLASRFTCSASTRSRTWNLIGAASTNRDVPQRCIWNTAGTPAFSFVNETVSAGGQ